MTTSSLDVLRMEASRRGLGVCSDREGVRTIFYQDIAGIYLHEVADFSRREDALAWLMQQPELVNKKNRPR